MKRLDCMATGLTETAITRVLTDAAVEKTPFGRVGQLEEMAGTIAFLLSYDSGFLTGRVIVASGG
jgi:3-oxoacyl-[acyl-carrier protein] reductase